VFRHADARAAIASILAGFVAFAAGTYGVVASQGARMLAPIATSLVVFAALAWLNRKRAVPDEVTALLASVSGEAATKTEGMK
jgi:hypothetical protein